MGISTLFSLSKMNIREVIPGMQIANYELESKPEGNVLHIVDSFYYKPDIEGRNDRIPVTSEEIVNSLVHMHLTSQLEYKPGCHPAVLAFPNEELTVEEIKKKYSRKILEALQAQSKWFIALVQIADDDWAKTKRHIAISDIQRVAARTLNLKREWLVVVDEEQAHGCPFCGSNLLDPEAPICPNCHKIHNPIKYAELEKKLGVTSVRGPEKTQ